MTAKSIEQLTLTLLAYCISYSTGFLFADSETRFNGELIPRDAEVCVTQNITFTSLLLEEPKKNFSIGFAVKNITTKGQYVAVDHDRIKKVNETVSQFSMYNITFGTEDVTDPYYFTVRSYYWKTFGDIDDTQQLGQGSVVLVYPLPEKIQDFKCIMLNYLSMRCTWNYGKDYYGEGNMPDVIFQWKIPSFSRSWTNCSHLNIMDGYCYWKRTTGYYITNKNITVRITLKQKCDINVSSEFNIDTSRIVQPNPLSSISSKVVNSTCIQLLWNTADSEPQHPKEHRVIVSAKGVNVQTIRFVTTRYTERHPHNLTICNLHPYTEHTFSVSIKPVGLYSGFYSDPRDIVSRTYSDVPSASPEVTDGGYYSYKRDCYGNGKKRRVCIFWKSIKNEHKNGPMEGILGQFTAIHKKGQNVREEWAEDSTYGCSTLLCSTSYNFTIKARNVNGTSESSSTLTIPTFASAIKSPQFIVESGNRSDVYISWDHRGKSNVKKFIVAWCRNRNGACWKDHQVFWSSFPSDAKDAVLQINSPHYFLYGVSVLTDHSSSGVKWQDCVYLKDGTPDQKPQNVFVSAGFEDNTLVVLWDKLPCKSNEPYINMYNIQYRKRSEKYQNGLNVSRLGAAKVVLRDLEEDQTYIVTVRGITREGRYGPESEPETGVPINKSLKPAVIAVISVTVLVGVIFAGLGFFDILRRCEKKAQKEVKEARVITRSDALGQKDFGRQNSNDSGLDLTPSPD
ncbi:interleukin-6 receptor subunit beta-like isoform X2 [Mercenaria mercenaria]|uniref:interleukin-6 receptor subunit beta-like isoform X2 n=1 Tax=Mercenaria mercenaria TaxID=6596 RepID=UPI00234ED9C3|nr:interleukin-6 receptor subunit beta-like isoform X2 [Mercenaria mercenaria]